MFNYNERDKMKDAPKDCHCIHCDDNKKPKKKKCWQCKQYTVTVYKNEFGIYSETCTNKCGPALLGKQLRFF